MESSKNIIQKAVDQCIMIEKSLDNCLRAIQVLGIRKSPGSVKAKRAMSTTNLRGSPSYTICLGKRYPELKDIGEAEDPNLNRSAELITFEQANIKFQNILQTQEHLLHRINRMLETESLQHLPSSKTVDQQ